MTAAGPLPLFAGALTWARRSRYQGSHRHAADRGSCAAQSIAAAVRPGTWTGRQLWWTTSRCRYMVPCRGSESAGLVALQILGPLRIWRDGVELDPGPRQQAQLLAVLLASAGRPISTTELHRPDLGHDVPASALNIIQKYVGALRRLLEPSLAARGSGSYLLRHGTGICSTRPLACWMSLTSGNSLQGSGSRLANGRSSRTWRPWVSGAGPPVKG